LVLTSETGFDNTGSVINNNILCVVCHLVDLFCFIYFFFTFEILMCYFPKDFS